MPKKNDQAPVPQMEEHKVSDKKYSTKKLLKSRHLADYQPDFARVILTEPAYSISEARAALDKALKGGD